MTPLSVTCTEDALSLFFATRNSMQLAICLQGAFLDPRTSPVARAGPISGRGMHVPAGQGAAHLGNGGREGWGWGLSGRKGKCD